MNIDILALGDSVKAYKPDGSITWGVNDICKIRKVDNLLIIDKQEKFTQPRIQTIWQSQYKQFYSHLDEWSFMAHYNRITLGKRGGKLTQGVPPTSVLSPFVAVGLAYLLHKPQTITLWGVDLGSHPKLSNQITEIRADFKDLFLQLHKLNCKLQLGINAGALSGLIPPK